MTAADAIRDVLAANRAELVAFARKRAGHLLDPEDVVHRAAARALAQSGSLRDPARARAWLFRILRNELVDELRRLGLPAVELPEELADPTALAPNPDRGRPCQCALEISRDLKPEYNEILQKAVLDDVPVVDIARELGISANNANVRLHRARKALRDAVKHRCGVSSAADCLTCTCDASRTCVAAH
jgi:RNA polymerase sigma factor (sigma-70 family)